MKWEKKKDTKTHICAGEKFRYAYQTNLKLLLIKNIFPPEIMVSFEVKNLQKAKQIVQLLED